MRAPDFFISNHGSIILVRPVNERASQWINENVAGETQFFGPALVVEARYLMPLIEGILGEGFCVGGMVEAEGVGI